MSAKQRHKQRVKQRLGEKLTGLETQEEALYSIIRDYVAKVKVKAREVLVLEDTSQFLTQYPQVDQLLDRAYNTCELLTVTAEDMFDGSQDEEECTDLSAPLLESTALEDWGDNIKQPQATSTPGETTDIEQKFDSKAEALLRESMNRDGSSSCKQAPVSVECTPRGDADTTLSSQSVASKTKHKTEVQKEDVKEKLIKSLLASPKKWRGKVSKAGEVTKGVPSPVKTRLNESYNVEQGCSKEQISSGSLANSPKMKGIKSSKNKKTEQARQKSSELTVTDSGASCNVAGGKDGVANVTVPAGMKVKSTMSTGAISYDSQSIGAGSQATCVGSQSTGAGSQATCVGSQSTGAGSQATCVGSQSAGSCVKAGGESVLSHGALLANKPTPVIVTEIISPFCFFVQKNGPSLGCLMEEICEYMVGVGGNEDALLKNPAVGMVCLACYSKDRAFYRAHITGIHTLGTDSCVVDVLYVDYGNKERVRANQLRRLPAKFTTLPTQAICCALAQVMPCNKYRVWTEEDIFTFKQYVFNQQLTCIPVCHSSDPQLPYLIKLVTSIPMPAMVCATSISIGQILVSRASAKYVDVMEQVNLLAKCPEGVEEVLILNGRGSAGTGVEIRELNDSSFLVDGDTKSSDVQTEHVDDAVKRRNGPVSGTGAVRTGIVPGLVLESPSVAVSAVNSAQTNFLHQATSVGRCGVKDESEEKLISPRSECSDTESQLGDIRHVVSGDVRSHASDLRTFHSTDARHQSGDTEKRNQAGDVRTSKSENKEKQKSDDVKMWRADDTRKNQSSGLRPSKSSDRRKHASSDKGKVMQTGSRVVCRTELAAGTEDQQIGHRVSALPGIQEENDSGRSLNANEQVNITNEETPAATEMGVCVDTRPKCDLEPDPAGQKVMMAHAVSPSQFYVHLVSLEVGHTLDNLMKKLGEHYENMSVDCRTQLSETVVPPSVGQLYCAQFTKDDCFYRARVKEISADDTGKSGKFYVAYVDYGDEEWIDCNQLLPLPEEFADVPPQAILCTLAYVRPFAWDRGQDWSAASKDMFKESTGGGDTEKTLLMYVVQGNFSTNENGEAVVEEGVQLEVLLVDSTGPEDQWECINKKLVSVGEAEFVPASCTEETGISSEGEEPLEWDPMAVDYYSKRNSYNIDVDDAGVATTGYKSSDESRICRFFSRGFNCWRGERCAFRHVYTDSGTTLEREEVYAVSNNQEELLPALHSWVAIEIATILSPTHFYALLPHGKKSLDGASGDIDMSMYPPGESADHPETLDNLLEALQVEYEKRPVHERKHIQVLKAPGEVVVARFSQDQQWYRARVIEVTEDKVKVFFLDYGNTEWLVDDDVADIEPQFLHLPFQAVECFLFQVESKDPGQPWSTEARSCFRELVDDKVLVGYVRSRSWSGCLCVELFDTSGSDDVNVGESLVQQGHAIWSGVTEKSGLTERSSVTSSNSSQCSEKMVFIPG